MFDRSDVVYSYDGSFDGFLCCVFASYENKELPSHIYNEKNSELYLLPTRKIVTKKEQADRVKASIPKKMGSKALVFLQETFLTCIEKKELYMLKFMYIGYKYGNKVFYMLADNTIHVLTKAVQNLHNEVHQYQGFVRFSIHDELMIAKIKPKNYVLTLLGPHFSERYPNENFLIYDQNHNMIYAHEKGKIWVAESANIELPKLDNVEKQYRKLWQVFYDTIAIEGRITNESLKSSRTRNRYLYR